MSKIKIKKFSKENANKNEVEEVFKIAKKLEDYLNEKETEKKIAKVNIPKAHSQKIQDIVTPFAKPKLGFTNEKEGLFERYENKKLRPDLYKKIEKGGIIIEVEKGKTLTNNMDLLDLWKCHICREANHLFLIVPIRDEAKGLNVFDNVCKRMSSFFIKENYLNIESLVIFGY